MKNQDHRGTQRPRSPQRPFYSAISACLALIVAVAVSSGLGWTVTAQQAPTRQHVEALAAEKLDGRLTGSGLPPA